MKDNRKRRGFSLIELMIVIAIILERYITRGLLIGAVKG